MERIIEQTGVEVAQTAAKLTVEILTEAIAAKGEAVWVLAGGTAPTATYQLLAANYADKVDWSKVKLLIGDERCVPKDHADANWQQINGVFISKLPFAPKNLLRPTAEDGPEAAAKSYQAVLETLPHNEAGVPQFDLVWVGMGEDGHTLSLFPGLPGIENTEDLVIPVHDSPKPPPERISFTLRTLGATAHYMIMATGAGKAPVLQQIAAGNHTFPVYRAAEAVENSGGSVAWLLDVAAATSNI